MQDTHQHVTNGLTFCFPRMPICVLVEMPLTAVLCPIWPSPRCPPFPQLTTSSGTQSRLHLKWVPGLLQAGRFDGRHEQHHLIHSQLSLKEELGAAKCVCVRWAPCIRASQSWGSGACSTRLAQCGGAFVCTCVQTNVPAQKCFVHFLPLLPHEVFCAENMLVGLFTTRSPYGANRTSNNYCIERGSPIKQWVRLYSWTNRPYGADGAAHQWGCSEGFMKMFYHSDSKPKCLRVSPHLKPGQVVSVIFQ